MIKKKPQWQINYAERVKAVQKALHSGYEFFLNTYIGKLKVLSLNEDWAHTGEGFHSRSWMICSTHIFRWAEEIGISEDYNYPRIK